MHQVGDQPRLYYDARSTIHQDLQQYISAHIPILFLSIVIVFYFEFLKKEAQFYRAVYIGWIICMSKTSYWQNCFMHS